MKPAKSPDGDATARALAAILTDLQDFEEAAERVRMQIEALAERHGVTLPRGLRPS